MINKGSKTVYFNPKQVEFYAKRCKTSVALCGRGFGKTEGIVAPHLHDLMTAMPRSLILLGCYSYRSLIKNIIPGICNTLDSLGYKENVDYLLNKMPPSGLKLDKPIRHISEASDSLWFYNGTVVFFGSVQFGFHNSLSFDAVIFDECRFLQEKKIDDLIPAMRGNLQHFGHLWQHGSQLYVSDKPDISNEKWLYDITDQATPDGVEEIYQYQRLLSKAEALLEDFGEKGNATLEKKIKHYKETLNELRSTNVLYFEASTFDNVTTIGLGPIKAYRKKLKDPEYARSVCNLDQTVDPNTFYPDLGTKHLVDLFNKDAIEGKDIRNLADNWRLDASIDPTLPLHIACDWGKNILCATVGQLRSLDSFRIVSSHYVKYPSKVKDLVALLSDYYEGFSKRKVIFHYNQTATSEGGIDSSTYSKEFTSKMEDKEWVVSDEYWGKAPEHEDNYIMWQKAMDFEDDDIPNVEFSHGPCEDLIISMQGAGLKKESGRIKKEKRPEKNRARNQAHTTHLSEAADMLLHGVCRMLEESGIIPSWAQK